MIPDWKSLNRPNTLVSGAVMGVDFFWGGGGGAISTNSALFCMCVKKGQEGGGKLLVGDLFAVSVKLSPARLHCITCSACGRNKGHMVGY